MVIPIAKDGRTAEMLARQAKAQAPQYRFAYDGNSLETVATWVEKYGRFLPMAGLTIDGKWAVQEMEILVNGQAPHRDWIEV